MKDKELPLGTTVYYSLEDYTSGDEIIYSSTITEIYDKELKFPNGTTLPIHFYRLDDGLSLQRCSFYTLPELFQLKDRLQFIQNNIRGDKNEYSTIYRESTTNQ